MRIYNYDPVTGEYSGTSEADESPLEPGVYLIPAHATDQPVPTAKAGQAAVYLDGAWRLVPDYRRQSVCLIDADNYFLGLASVALGEALDSRHILTDPPNLSVKKPKWSGKEWIDGRSTEEVEADALASTKAELRESDSDMARIAEDLIQTLISKGVIAESDIPAPARDKMDRRAKLRARLA